MNEAPAQVWLEEYGNNPSVVALCFSGGNGEEVSIGLTRQGVEATVDMLQQWLTYNDERMEELFESLTSWEENDA